MDYKQKFQALKSLDDMVCIRMHSNNTNFYVNWDYEWKREHVLEGLTGRGETPEEAIDNHWGLVTAEGRVMKGRKGSFRWNEFMWEAV